MILYDEKSFYHLLELRKILSFILRLSFSALSVVDKNSSVVDKKDTSIAGLRMFVAFLVFAKAPGK